MQRYLMNQDIAAVSLNIDDNTITVDLDLPELPETIEKNAFSSGEYPYPSRMKRGKYDKELEALQLELVKLQAWLQESGERIVIVFEGRDAAGKGGTINAFRHYLNPRHARTVALAKPSDVERGQWYFQRYVDHLPTAGEIVMYDRSWYNRGGVEPVMGFCTPDQNEKFLAEAPHFEHMLVKEGIHLFKIWLNIGQEMQIKRFHDRRHNPLKSWKLSPIDIKALRKWDDYTAARDTMLAATHTAHAPWTIVRSNDKRRARLNAIRHVLSDLGYAGKEPGNINETDPEILGSGPDFFNDFGC